MIKYFHHIGIVVANLDDTLSTYKKALGLEAINIVTYEEVKTRIACIQLGDFQIHLMTPTERGKGAIGEFLEKNGEGIHHIGLGVDNIESTAEDLKQNNIPLRDKSLKIVADGLRVAQIQPEFIKNVLIELIERK